jgi:hypothetical protein
MKGRRAVARVKPVLTVEQYRMRARQLQAETVAIAWSLVVSPAPIEKPRQWRSLTPDETMDVFDRLMRAVTRFHSAESAVVR